jgi:hypothetical protein
MTGFCASELTCDRIGQSQAITIGIIGLPQNNPWEVGGAAIVDAGTAILVVVAEGEAAVEVGDRAQISHRVIAVVNLLSGAAPGFLSQTVQVVVGKLDAAVEAILFPESLRERFG